MNLIILFYLIIIMMLPSKCPIKYLDGYSFLQNLFILIRSCSVWEMAKKELIMKPSFLHLFLVAALVLSSIMVTSSRFSWSTCDPACQMELTRTRRVLEKQDYSGYVPSPDDYDYNGFYRRQGDVPSPGIGH
ncbi:hypothetical protein ES332_D04G015800v1 [Gossypium tomentosum]|uniref:Uncharacterized protein n=1 Tax=Gossypium tomentosum TaxID=34277 RepID=A0A5D2L8E1_GOSTO|nr:hypothetical protein ES332_D04G015800v1 [Gossypium tomentosum]